MPEKKICVIGASGVVGSHVVQTALRKGYKVNASMRNPDDPFKRSWLTQLDNAPILDKFRAPINLDQARHLEFFGGDLEVPGSYDDAVKGCEGVFVCALPERPRLAYSSDPKLIETVTEGIKHILQSCLEAGTVETVVITSRDFDNLYGGSTDLKEGQIIEQWAEADPEYQISKGKYSLAAKISMDEAALKFGEDHPDIRIVIFNPSMIVGPMFHPDMHGSLAFFKDILSQGDQLKEVPDDSMSFIDVRDLAQLELAALENKNAKGRYFGMVASWHWKDIVETIKKHYPEYSVPPSRVPSRMSDGAGSQGDAAEFENRGTPKKKPLHVHHFSGLDEIIGQAIEHLKVRGEL